MGAAIFTGTKIPKSPFGRTPRSVSLSLCCPSIFHFWQVNMCVMGRPWLSTWAPQDSPVFTWNSPAVVASTTRLSAAINCVYNLFTWICLRCTWTRWLPLPGVLTVQELQEAGDVQFYFCERPEREKVKSRNQDEWCCYWQTLLSAVT